MTVIAVDPFAPDRSVLRRAAAVLRGGGLVAFPTETVYGLGANALDEAAVLAIFAAKGRPAYNPLIAHVASLAAARALGASWPEVAERLGERFWPGPLTLVIPKRPDIPDVVTAGRPTVALRVPAHPVARALLEEVDLPIAAPSANRFTHVSPTTAAHVERGLGGRVGLILDGGPTTVGIESTVVDLTGDTPVLLRPGALPAAAIESITGPLAQPTAVEDGAARPSPGMVKRHYSPRARLLLFPADRRDEMALRARDAADAGVVAGGLLRWPLEAPLQHPIRMPGDPAAYARELYAALHRLDDRGCELILADAVPEAAEWAGIRDRLARAAYAD